MITAKVITYTNRKDKTKPCPLKLRITEDRVSKFYDCSFSDGEKIISAYVPAALAKLMSAKKIMNIHDKNLRDAILEREASANNLINKMKVFSFEQFEKLFFKNTGFKNSVQAVFSQVISDLKDVDRVKTAVSYQNAITSLLKFNKDKDFRFGEVTPSFLKKYEKWMLEQKRSKTTIGMYLRALRVIYNTAVENDLIDKESYPFGKRKYSIPKGKNVKKALGLEDIGRIWNYQTLDPSKAKARDFFLFSYLCNGMNIKDIVSLKHSNISGDFICFERSKTAGTNKAPKIIQVSIKERAREIMRKYGTVSLDKDNYIFAILNKNMDAEARYKAVNTFIRFVNDNMGKICQELEIEYTGTMAARHSFASILKNNNVSPQMISEALGHSSLTVTENYFASFDQKQIATETDILIPKTAN